MFGLSNNFLGMASGLLTSAYGTSMEVQGLRSAGKSAYAAAEYNAKLVDFNLNRTIDDLQRTARRNFGQQTAALASNNLSISSAGARTLYHEALATYERESVRRKTSADIEKQGILFEGKAQKEAYENRARSAMFSGMGNIASGINPLLGSLL